jgi:FlaA1/EpsC-like NDP-sugar epimerase
MGTPIKIMDMARDFIRRSGFKPDVDIEIKEIGLRLGEKLHEELITEGEGIIRSDHEKLFILKEENNYDLNWLNQKIEELVELAMRQDAEGIKSKLKEIVPEYTPFDMSNSISSTS